MKWVGSREIRWLQKVISARGFLEAARDGLEKVAQQDDVKGDEEVEEPAPHQLRARQRVGARYDKCEAHDRAADRADERVVVGDSAVIAIPAMITEEMKCSR